MKNFLHTASLLLLSLLSVGAVSAQSWMEVPDPFGTKQVYHAGNFQSRLWLLDAGNISGGTAQDRLRLKQYDSVWNTYSEFRDSLADSLIGGPFAGFDSTLYVAVTRYKNGTGEAGVLVFSLRTNTWTTLPSADTKLGPGSRIRAMEVYKNEIYLAGNLINHAGQNQLIRIKPDLSFAEVIAKTNKPSRYLTVYQNELIIAGEFDSIEDQSFLRMVRFDGTNFLHFGAGFNGISFLKALKYGDLAYVQEDAVEVKFLNIQGPGGDQVRNGDFAPDFSIRDLDVLGGHYVAIQHGSQAPVTPSGVYLFDRTVERWHRMKSSLDPSRSIFVQTGKVLYLVELSGRTVHIERCGVARITGRVFVDIDGDCAKTAGDRELGQSLLIEDLNSDTYWYTDENGGGFGSFVNDGPHQLQLPAVPVRLSSKVCTWNHSLNLKDGEEVQVDIPLSVIDTAALVRVELVAESGWRARQGFIENYNLHIYNEGFRTNNCPVTLTLPEEIVMMEADITPVDSGFLNGRRYFTWSIPVAPFQHRIIRFKAWTFTQTPSYKVVDLNAFSDVACLRIENERKLSLTVVGAYDPNDKQCFPPGELEPGTKLVRYHIRFQNTGSAEAKNVHVIDTLDTNLPIGSYTLTDYSHDIKISVQGRVVKFSFYDIYLPDSTSDLEGSQGYITFEAELSNDLEPGDSVRNKAYIYFDYQPAVETNTVLNKMKIMSVDIPDSRQRIRIYPNPTDGRFTVENDGQTVSAILIDPLGRVHETFVVEGGSASPVQIKALSPGIYYLCFPALGQKEILVIH